MKFWKCEKTGKNGMSNAFYGISTLSDRGQIVIPSEARADLDFSPGDKLVVMRHPIHNGIMMFKFEALQEFLEEFQSQVEEISKFSSEAIADAEMGGEK